MQMQRAIDVGTQIQTSVADGGYMAGIVEEALRSGGVADFMWGPKRFSPGLDTPAGRSVGRFSGVVEGTLSITGNSWTATGTITINPDTYSFALDGPNLVSNLAIAAGAITPNVNSGTRGVLGLPAPNFVGDPMTLNYNRTYDFTAFGHVR